MKVSLVFQYTYQTQTQTQTIVFTLITLEENIKFRAETVDDLLMWVNGLRKLHKQNQKQSQKQTQI